MSERAAAPGISVPAPETVREGRRNPISASWQDRAEYAAFRLAERLLARLPRPAALRAGGFLGTAAYALDVPHRRIARINLRLSFPEKTETERRSILLASCRNLGRVAAEVCHFPRLRRDNLHRYVSFADRLAWENAIREIEKRGGLILTGHLGNWELLAYAHGLLGHPVTIVHRPMRNPLVEAAIARLRSGAGTRVVAKRRAAKDLLRTLRTRGTVAIPIDQNQPPGWGVFVDFFGIPACTTFGLARLALLSGAPVYPAFLVREGETERHRIVVLPAIEAVRTGNRERDILVNTQRYTQVLEEVIRRHPEQWIWFHRRWRTRPPGAPPLY